MLSFVYIAYGMAQVAITLYIVYIYDYILQYIVYHSEPLQCPCMPLHAFMVSDTTKSIKRYYKPILWHCGLFQRNDLNTEKPGHPGVALDEAEC